MQKRHFSAFGAPPRFRSTAKESRWGARPSAQSAQKNRLDSSKRFLSVSGDADYLISSSSNVATRSLIFCVVNSTKSFRMDVLEIENIVSRAYSP